MPPSVALVFAGISGLIELAGGLLLAAGLFTPIAAFALVAPERRDHRRRALAELVLQQGRRVRVPAGARDGRRGGPVRGPRVAPSLDATIGFTLAPEVRAVLFVAAILGGLATLAVPALTARRTHPQGGVPQAR